MPSQGEGSSGWWGEGALAYPAIVDKHGLCFLTPISVYLYSDVYSNVYIDESAECRKRCSAEAHLR